MLLSGVEGVIANFCCTVVNSARESAAGYGIYSIVAVFTEQPGGGTYVSLDKVEVAMLMCTGCRLSPYSPSSLFLVSFVHLFRKAGRPLELTAWTTDRPVDAAAPGGPRCRPSRSWSVRLSPNEHDSLPNMTLRLFSTLLTLLILPSSGAPQGSARFEQRACPAVLAAMADAETAKTNAGQLVSFRHLKNRKS